MIRIIVTFFYLCRDRSYAHNKQDRVLRIRKNKKNLPDPPKMHLKPKSATPNKTNLDHLRKAYEKRFCFVKMYNFQSLRDVNYITSELSNGNILLLNTESLLGNDNSMVEVKRAIDQLRGYCREYGGEMKRVGDYMLVITPNRNFRIS